MSWLLFGCLEHGVNRDSLSIEIIICPVFDRLFRRNHEALCPGCQTSSNVTTKYLYAHHDKLASDKLHV